MTAIGDFKKTSQSAWPYNNTDGSTVAFWQFTTVHLSPEVFNKVGPSDGKMGHQTEIDLIWTSSSGVTSYEYYFDKSDDDSCKVWMDNGTFTLVKLSGLDSATTYYWQIRAVNGVGTTYADGGLEDFWQFETIDYQSFLPLIRKD
ncbi:MAG: fibronectin type III domain-containing protein [Chloroflexota bacterium]|nr:fibronectin type III domain-containing protein [Chloroflexota bacterium]